MKRKPRLVVVLERENVYQFFDVFASQLSMKMRLLRHIAGRVFFSKIGRFNFVSGRGITTMYPHHQITPLESAIKTRTSLLYWYNFNHDLSRVWWAT